MPGCFIVLDGTDGCGKSTQARLLAEALKERGKDVVLTLEPGDTNVGAKIRDILLDPDTGDMDALTEALLFCADRAEHVSTVIRPALQAGKTVICDRFASATAVYQGFAGRLGFDLAQQLNEIATIGLQPDLLVVLDIDIEHANERLSRQSDSSDRMEQNSEGFFSCVRQGFLKYAQIMGDRAVVVDATQSIWRVHRQILQLVDDIEVT